MFWFLLIDKYNKILGFVFKEGSINCFFFVKLQFKNPQIPQYSAVLKFHSPQKI